MKKNGFTLVELMGVIAVMAVLIVVVATNGFGAFNKAKSGIDKLEEDNLLEAARVFLVDVDNNFLKTTDYPEGCLRSNFIDDFCEVSVQYLEDYDYFDDKANRCDGKINLKIERKKDLSGNIIETNYIAVKQSDTDVICSNS